MFDALLAISAYEVLFPVGLILVVSKLFSVFAKKTGMPQILAMLLTGIAIGLFAMIPSVKTNFITDGAKDGIKFISEIGVVLILFSAGLGTDIKQVKACGFSAFLITILDVAICMILGGFFSWLMLKDSVGDWSSAQWKYIFYGVIITATSVSVSVASLQELGKLNSKIGTTIVSAAILDDIIGVIILSVVLSLSNSGGADSDVLTTTPFSKMFGYMMPETAANIMCVILQTVLFFAFVFLLGFIVRKIFTHLEQKYSHHRRLPIYGIGFCFIVAFLSQKLFGIADITGAYFAGLILAGRSSTEYVERRTSIASYIIFTPVFFANIGISTDWSAFADSSFLTFAGFGMVYVLCAIAGKFFGASIGAKATGNGWRDSIACGTAMTVRAEVCLVSANKGIDAGLVDDRIKIFLMVLIVFTSIVVPILLKLYYRHEQNGNHEGSDNLLIEDQLHVNDQVHNKAVMGESTAVGNPTEDTIGAIISEKGNNSIPPSDIY